MTALERFEDAVHGPWKTVGKDVQYRVEVVGNVVRVYFQCTKSWLDWLYNFCVAVVRGGTLYGKYRIHAGYALAFESAASNVLWDIADALPSKGQPRIEIYGYSLGGCMAILLHLYIKQFWGGITVQTWTFGAPRVLFGAIPPAIVGFLETVTSFKVRGDLASLFMPKITGYTDVGMVVPLGKPRKVPSLRWHKSDEYRKYLGDYILGTIEEAS